MLIVILGKSMVATLPSKPLKVPGTSWSFSMHLGLFNIKEHVLPPQGQRGALHEVEVKPKRGITKLQFFVVVSVTSFAYAMIPGYFFPSIGVLSVVCLFWKSSVIAQHIDSGRNGFGIASFTFNWNVVSGYLSNPDAWQQFKRAYGNSNNSTSEDVHNRLMKEYNPVPQWWFCAIIISTIGLLIFSCEGFGKQLQLPYWGILLSCLLVMIFILPLGVLSATTGQYITLNVVAEVLIDDRIHLSWQTNSRYVENICEPEKLPKGSPWTCRQITASYDFSVIWGMLGPKHMFFPDGMYSKLYYFFLIGTITPLLIWVSSKLFPEKGWIKSINIPVILGGASALLGAGTYKDWWAKYNYLLAYGLDSGVAFQALLMGMTLQMSGINGVNWWGLDVGDHCPLSQCPIAPGVLAQGCPVL
ncbi:hypothetical protein Q3G72_033466 [Acer saccharum]|nr:hypothetical protein Q3G72_033466 [Acer saccharum]